LVFEDIALVYFAERLAHPRRGRKPEFKQEAYPPLDGTSYSQRFMPLQLMHLAHPALPVHLELEPQPD